MPRQFSVPYNGDDPESFMEEIFKRREAVHDVYLGCPGTQDFFTNTLLENCLDYYENCVEFMKLAEIKGVPVVITANAQYNHMRPDEKNLHARMLSNYIRKYKVSGIVCSDLDIAETIHRTDPDIEINTSCNNPHYNVYSLIEWREKAGVTLVNPPRDTVRDYAYLKSLKERGFRVKLLVNEFCYLNCGRITQFCEVARGTGECRSVSEKRNPLLTCRLFPEQLDDFDLVVDIYKIQGRWLETDYIFRVLDIYREGRSCRISDIKGEKIKGNLDFMTSDIDPALMKYWLHCERDCYKCNRCKAEFERLTGIK